MRIAGSLRARRRAASLAPGRAANQRGAAPAPGAVISAPPGVRVPLVRPAPTRRGPQRGAAVSAPAADAQCPRELRLWARFPGQVAPPGAGIGICNPDSDTCSAFRKIKRDQAVSGRWRAAEVFLRGRGRAFPRRVSPRLRAVNAAESGRDGPVRPTVPRAAPGTYSRATLAGTSRAVSRFPT